MQTKRSVKTEPTIKWWRLHEQRYFSFREQSGEILHATDETTNWQHIPDAIREIGRNGLRVSSGTRKCDKERWWWNPEVQKSAREKQKRKGTGS